MKHYFGYIKSVEVFGFLDEGDPRITPDLIELTEEEHKQLMKENSQGRTVVLYEGKVFTAPSGQYYPEGDKFIKKSDDVFASEEATRLKNIQKQIISEQLDELDKKRIRAMCEPSVKDSKSGETWLDYYNKQVEELRKQLSDIV